MSARGIVAAALAGLALSAGAAGAVPSFGHHSEPISCVYASPVVFCGIEGHHSALSIGPRGRWLWIDPAGGPWFRFAKARVLGPGALVKLPRGFRLSVVGPNFYLRTKGPTTVFGEDRIERVAGL